MTGHGKPVAGSPAGRAFPMPRWSWPSGSRHQLLVSAIHGDKALAAKSFVAWMQSQDIDDVSWGEQRLLLAIAARFPEASLDVPNRGRLNGLVRVFWTRSRLALRAAEPAVALLNEAGIECLLIKGAARGLSSASGLKGRVANDVDIVVQPEAFPRAIALLGQDGWEASDGKSALRSEALAHTITGLNFIKGDFGDVDLHQSAVHRFEGADGYNAGLWARSHVLQLGAEAVRVPSSTDQLIIALLHGGVSGHDHSDWVLDCAALFADPELDVDLFLALCDALDLEAQAYFVLTYLNEALGCAVGDALIARLGRSLWRKPVSYFASLFEAKPANELGPLSDLLRSFFKQQRLRARRREARRQAEDGLAVVKLRPGDQRGVDPSLTFETRCKITVPSGARWLDLVLQVPIGKVLRRYDFELNGVDFHVARLTCKQRGLDRVMVYGCRIDLEALGAAMGGVATGQAEGRELVLEARPRRVASKLQDQEGEDKLGLVPFALLSSRSGD